MGCDVFVSKNENSDSLFETQNLFSTLGVIEWKQLEILHAYSKLLAQHEPDLNLQEHGEQNLIQKQIEEIQMIQKNNEDLNFEK